MAAIEDFVSLEGWRITVSENEDIWPTGRIVTISRNGESSLDLHWTTSDNHALWLHGVPFLDGRAQGVAEAGEGTYLVRLDLPEPGKLKAVVEPTVVDPRHQHLAGVWGADAGG